jgi:hypothetical protein
VPGSGFLRAMRRATTGSYTLVKSHLLKNKTTVQRLVSKRGGLSEQDAQSYSMSTSGELPTLELAKKQHQKARSLLLKVRKLKQLLSPLPAYEFPITTSKQELVMGSFDRTRGMVKLMSELEPDTVVYALPPGKYKAIEDAHTKAKHLSLEVRDFDVDSMFDSLRIKLSQRQVIDGLEDIVIGLDAIGDLSHDNTFRPLAVQNMVRKAYAIVRALRDLDAETAFPLLSTRLGKLVAQKRPLAWDVVSTTLDTFEETIQLDPVLPLSKVLAGAKLLARMALEVDFLEPMPVVSGISNGFELMQDTFRLLSVAKASTDLTVKTKFLQHLDENIFPHLKSELAFLQGMAMFVAYMPIEQGAHLRRQVTFWETDLERNLTSNPVHFELFGSVEHVVDDALYARFKQLDLRFHPSAKIQIWRAKKSSAPEIVLNCTGTTSYGKDFDARWKEQHVATGALGNVDPFGISKSSAKEAIDNVLRVLKKAGATGDSRITVTGHSQGGAVALRVYYWLKLLGYQNVTCVGFSAPGLDMETVSQMMLLLGVEGAARDVHLVDDPKDWVPTAGEITPFGTKMLVPTTMTQWSWKQFSARWGIVDNRFDDWILGHGTPGLVWRMIHGGPLRHSRETSAFNWNSTVPVVEYGRASTGLVFFKPGPRELALRAREKDESRL